MVGVVKLSPNSDWLLANCAEVLMSPKPADAACARDLFRTELIKLLHQPHELVQLAALVD